MVEQRRPTRVAIPSDALRTILSLRDAVPALALLLQDVMQIVVVLDASAVHAELRWRLGSRVKPTARTALHETIDSGVIIAIAPTFLKQEIEKYLDLIASETGTSIDAARTEWVSVQRMIRFYVPRGDGSEFASIDPKDSPYALAAQELEADFIRTTDSHFTRMGVGVIKQDVDLMLRDYARSTSVVVAVKVGSGLVLTVGIEALAGAVRSIVGIIRRVPPAAKLLLVTGITIALLHPDSRQKLVQLLKDTWENLKKNRAVVATSQRAFARLADAARTSSITGEAIKSKLRVRGKQTALSHARLVCLKSGKPLTVGEIADRILNAGYSSRSKTFVAYVGQLLRNDRAFVRNAEGLWTFGV